jgi:methionyl-tRNA formyltransferase
MSEQRRPVRAVIFSLLPQFTKVFDQLLDSRGDKLVGLVVAPGPRTRRTDEYRAMMELARPGLDVIVSNFPNRWADMIRPIQPDVIFCIGSNWKIPDDVINLPPLGTINGHDGYLPKYRGRNATGWALRTGEPGYGVSFHRMTSDFDCGPVVAQSLISIADDEDFDDLVPRIEQTFLKTLSEAYDRVVEGFPGTPQDESEATEAGGAFEPEWREIDWNMPARDVFFQIRSWCGMRGVPRGAFGEIDGTRTLITKAKPVTGASFPENGVAPGSIVSRNDGELLVQCADQPLRVMNWKPVPGDSWSGGNE